MKRSISFDRKDETLASKSIWFASLSFSQRMDWLAQYTAMIFHFNPRAAHEKPVGPRQGSVLILEREADE